MNKNIVIAKKLLAIAQQLVAASVSPEHRALIDGLRKHAEKEYRANPDLNDYWMDITEGYDDDSLVKIITENNFTNLQEFIRYMDKLLEDLYDIRLDKMLDSDSVRFSTNRGLTKDEKREFKIWKKQQPHIVTVEDFLEYKIEKMKAKGK